MYHRSLSSLPFASMTIAYVVDSLKEQMIAALKCNIIFASSIMRSQAWARVLAYNTTLYYVQSVKILKGTTAIWEVRLEEFLPAQKIPWFNPE